MVVGITGKPTTWLLPSGPRHVCQFDSLFGAWNAVAFLGIIPEVNATPMLEQIEACLRMVRRDKRSNVEDDVYSRDEESKDGFILVTGKIRCYV